MKCVAIVRFSGIFRPFIHACTYLYKQFNLLYTCFVYKYCFSVADEGIEIGYSASGTTTTSESSESFSSSEAAANDRNLQESKPMVFLFHCQMGGPSIF